MDRRTQPLPGEESSHDAFEGLLDTVWKQEHYWKFLERLDQDIERDESRARRQAKNAPLPQVKPDRLGRKKKAVRVDRRPPSADARSPRRRGGGGSSQKGAGGSGGTNQLTLAAQAVQAGPGVAVLVSAALVLAAVGLVFETIVKLARSLL